MTSWVHLFSKFSPEALLFEVIFICLGIAAYAAWVILKKRREAPSEDLVPGSVVKVYLNELLTEAEQMRDQLSELVHASGGTLPPPQSVERKRVQVEVTAAAPANDPAMLEKILTLESKMREQSVAMQSLMNEKIRIERELERTKSTVVSSSGEESGDSSALRKKIEILEGRLAEYSVIEDDLANLKRLQQENSQLRAQVAKKQEAESLAKDGLAQIEAQSEAVTVIPSTPPPAADTSVVVEGSAPQASPAEVVTETILPVLEPAIAASSEPAPSPAPAADPKLEQLAEQVDQSLQQAQAPAITEPAPEEAPKKSEADLLAEFEKMING